MSDEVKITCPRCGHKWEQSLKKLEKMVEVYRDIDQKHTKKETVKYRAICPVDGTYIILEVEED